MLFVVTLMWQKNGRKVNTYLDRQAMSLKIDTIVSTHWYPLQNVDRPYSTIRRNLSEQVMSGLIDQHDPIK
jgi:hypothetical protein